MLEEIKNFYRISDSIATAGQPTPEQFHDIKQEGFDVVINLAQHDSPDAIENEEAIIAELNLDYVHIPVDFEAPVLSELKRFFATMDRYRINNVFVHCACNWRVAAFMFLYQTVRCDVPVTVAADQLHAVWQPDETWQTFIDSVLIHYNIDT